MNGREPQGVQRRHAHVLLFLTIVLLAIVPSELASSQENPKTIQAFLIRETLELPLEELITGMDWGSWYQARSGFAPNPAYFGAYVTLAVNDYLYIGLGTARPAENIGDGALVAHFDGTHLVSIGSLTEQGVHDMLWGVGRLHIAGTDPCCGDDWSAGNHYSYVPPGPMVKYRDPINGLVSVLHTWGLWIAEDGSLIAAVSSDHSGTRVGEIFHSADQGTTWTKLSELGGYRSYDIVGYHGKLYATYVDVLDDPLRLAVSTDGGLTWMDVMADGMHRFRLTEFREQLLVVSFDRSSIYALRDATVTAEASITRYDMPQGVKIGMTDTDGRNYNYNLLATAFGHLYTIWENNLSDSVTYAIVRTTDLQHWEQVATTREPLISLSYWLLNNWLIAGGTGSSAKLWKVALLDAPFSFFLPITRH